MSVAEALAEAQRRGLVVREGEPVRAKLGGVAPPSLKAGGGKPALVGASFTQAPVPTWTIPLHVTAGDNNRGKAKIGRAAHERRVVSRCLGGATLKYLAAFADLAARGQTVTVTLTRLGGRALDDDNAVAAMKFVRDVVALMMGFDDSPRSPLRFVVAQQPGGACGVRVELRCLTAEGV